MKNKGFIIAMLIMTIALFSGCWDAYEIKENLLISLVGVDKEEAKVRFYLEFLNPSYQESNNASDNARTSLIIKAEGKTFTEARSSYLRRGSNNIFLGSVRAIVFSNNYAENGIEEYLNRVRGIREYRKNVTLLTTTTKFDKLLDSKAIKSRNIGFDVEHLNETLVNKKMLYKSTIVNALEESQVKNTGYIINNLDLINKRIELSGYSIFKDNKMIGLIKGPQIRVVNYLILNKPVSELTVDFKDIRVAVLAKTKRKKVETHYDGKKISFKVSLFIDFGITDLSRKVSFNDKKKKELSEKVSEIIKQEVQAVIKTSKEKYGCDYLYFYEYFRAKYNTEFKTMNWNEKYKEAKFEIEVKSNITDENLVSFD